MDRVFPMGGESVVFRQTHCLKIHIGTDHIGPDFVAGDRIGVIDEVGGEAAGRAHVAFQSDEFTFFGKAGLILFQDKKLDMEEPLFDAEGFHHRSADLFEGFFVDVVKRESKGIVVVIIIGIVIHHGRDRGHEMIARTKNDVGMGIAYPIETDDETIDVFFHDVDFGEFLGQELLQFRFAMEGEGLAGADPDVGFHKNRPAHLDDEILGFLEIGGPFKQEITHRFGSAFLKARFHGGFGFDRFHLFRPEPGLDAHSFAKFGVHFKPPFIIRFDEIDFAVFRLIGLAEGQHFGIVAHIIDELILGQGGL